MVSIKFFGGVGEIGGNKILIETSKARVFFDFGMSFKRMGMFYDEFMNPRKYNGIGDFIEMGLIPWQDGLYRNDFVKKAGKEESELKFDAVFLSHGHTDHTAMIPLLHNEIPIYCSSETKKIIQSMQETGNASFGDYVKYRECFTGLHYTKNPQIDRPINIFKKGDKIVIKDLEIEPIPVDHSVPGAFGFAIHTPKGTIIYSGDLRLHGSNGKLTEEFAEQCATYKPEILLIEGTRITGDKSVTEKQVEEKIDEYVKKTKELVIANFPPRDIDRFMTFYNVAKQNKRKLIINFKLAYLLKLLKEDDPTLPDLEDEFIQIYCKRAKDGRITEGFSYEEYKKDYATWEREFLALSNYVTSKMIDQKKSIFYCNAWGFGELIDIKPKKGSSYIYSLCEPFNDEMELDMIRVKNWLEHFDLPFYTAHASGHASKSDLFKIVKKINPKTIVPIHSEKPEFYKETGMNVKIPSIENEIKL
ncbi:MAG: MBL fold metallo-hydrolase [Candidatus Woesearchaeota archaeon]